ncbi:immunoglobulin superfamily member 5 isoform X2 [Etheostoma spectabile]|uniref:immunoglobulin superfamily member 5 isoform X2 n=1 Tax=Etheostoma spectabile TaxID=54343 RepID=UPI0013AF3027|nr:immunoglobulin superfamily member 5 isoform X2 [Etheostoma spectabile]
MSVSWRPRPKLFCLCLILCATGVSGVFQLQPLNAAVLQGSDARFNATVQGNWEFMTWKFQDIFVLAISGSGNVTSTEEQFSARFCSGGDASCVEFIIHNVSRNESGPVVCSVLGGRSKTAQLEVQEHGTVNITGENVTAMQDQQVEFRCVTSAWYPTPTVSWTWNGQAVDSSLYNTSSMADGDTFNSTSVLKFQAERNTTVECRATVQALTNPQSSSVFLVVVPKPPDWTVLIAVVLSFGGCALLALLIIGIIFCYKRRKEKQTNYKDEISKRVRTQSPAAVQGVFENTGYVSEGETSVAPSKHTDSGFGQAIGSNVYVVPVYSLQAINGSNNTVDQSGFRKHRHVTIV